MYGGDGILTAPSDPNIQERDGYLEILGCPAAPKLGIDSHVGWFGYMMQNNLCWIKKYPTYPDRAYGEIANCACCASCMCPALHVPCAHALVLS